MAGMADIRIGVVDQGREEKLAPYVNCCAAAGAVVEVLRWHGVPEDDVVRFDGVVLCGGDDVDARRWGEANHPAVELADPGRDEYEIRFVRAAVAQGVPLLGVCRGAQVMNVALGGTLTQHVPDLGGAVRHGGGTRHPVQLLPGTELRRIANADRATVNSHHHQAVGRLSPRLRVSARADDGLVEAVEGVAGTAAFLVGIQWHPEREGNDACVGARLFESLVRAAGARAAGIPGRDADGRASNGTARADAPQPS